MFKFFKKAALTAAGHTLGLGTLMTLTANELIKQQKDAAQNPGYSAKPKFRLVAPISGYWDLELESDTAISSPMKKP